MFKHYILRTPGSKEEIIRITGMIYARAESDSWFIVKMIDVRFMLLSNKYNMEKIFH